MRGSPQLERIITMAALILAGEAIYTIPYIRQTFHSSLLDAMNLTNGQLGRANSLFGVVAMVSYFPGGWLADRFSPRHLMTVSLTATGCAGLVYATFPPYPVLLGLHAFMGVSTILTFWAALVKATRYWGGEEQQGTAFGILDGGRGVVEAVLATAATFLFSLYAIDVHGLSAVLVLYSGGNFVAALMAWRFVPAETIPVSPQQRAQGSLTWTALRLPSVWLLAAIILLAYAAYWGTHDFNAFATEGLGHSSTYGATLATFRVWFRPAAAVAAGLLADRLRPTTVIAGSFIMAGLGFSALVMLPAPGGWLLWIDVAVTAVAVFALRGTYYAVMQEARIPAHLTGTVVGLVSEIGYTPDIFIPAINGWLFDHYPGAAGHRIFFAYLAAGCVAGVVLTFAIRRFDRKTPQLEELKASDGPLSPAG